MRVSNSVLVLAITFVIGFVIFLSSYIAVNYHHEDNPDSSHEDKHTAIKDRFQSLKRKSSKATSKLSASTEDIERDEAATKHDLLMKAIAEKMKELNMSVDSETTSALFHDLSKSHRHRHSKRKHHDEVETAADVDQNTTASTRGHDKERYRRHKHRFDNETDANAEVISFHNLDSSGLIISSPVSQTLLSAKTNVVDMQTSHHPANPDPRFEPAETSEVVPCTSSYEPTCEMYPYVRFWRKRFHKMDCYSSPLRHKLKSNASVAELKYLVFQPDGGGWNNIRMAAETAMIFGHATGRVIVMPPETKWYLLDKNNHHEDDKSTFEKFFDLRKISESVDIISMDEFIRTVAQPGLLKAPLPITLKFMSKMRDGEMLWKYLEKACFVRQWEPGKYFIGFNFTRDKATRRLSLGHLRPTKRMKLFASHDRKVLPYDDNFHNEKAVFFPGDYRNTHRILTHFYSYLYWANPHLERIYKRLVRDRLHYHDDIFCAAGKIVKLLHVDASKLTNQPVQDSSAGDSITLGGDTNKDATYFAYHIRRGDFQYKHTRLSIDEIWKNTRHLWDAKRTRLMYIATDEKNRTMFDPLKEVFELKFLDDYLSAAGLDKATNKNFNNNHIGMIEQVICANAHTFVGTPLSTFTGYITRMRGYYRDNRYSRTFYTLKENMYQLHKQPELIGPFWAREFAVAHRDVDDDPNP